MNLLVAPQRRAVPVHHLHVPHKRQRRQDHEQRRHIFQRPGKRTERRVIGGKPAGGNGGQGVNRGLERIHPQRHIGQQAHQRQRHIDDRDLRGNFSGTGQDFSQCVETFGPENLHPANPQFRQKHHRHHDDPDAAQPLQNAAPQQQPLGQIVQPGKHRGPGGCQPRHGFEYGIDQSRLGRAENEG